MSLVRVKRKLTRHLTNRKHPVGVSFPKSGRTWVRKMLYDLDLRIPFTHEWSSNYERAESAQGEISAEFFDRSVLFILRDPRDVLVSYHKDLCERHGVFKGSLMEMAQTPGIGIDGICTFNTTWIDAADQFRDFLLVRYEDVQMDAELELKRMSTFLGGFWNFNSRIRSVVAQSTFDQMKRAERSGDYADQYPKFWFEGARAGNYPKVRRGKIGGFVDEMPADVIEYCNERLAQLAYPSAYLAPPGTSGH